MIKGDELLKKYNWIWEKVKKSPKKEFYSQPVYNENNSYNGKTNTNFMIIKYQSKVLNLFIDQ